MPDFDSFYRLEFEAVAGLAYVLSGSRIAAEDLAQEGFLGTINPDSATLMRNEGWALYMCIAGIPYYLHTNPGFVKMARNTLTQILGRDQAMERCTM